METLTAPIKKEKLNGTLVNVSKEKALEVILTKE